MTNQIQKGPNGPGGTAQPDDRKTALVKALICFFLLVSVALAWRLTPLKEAVDFETIIAWQQSLKDYPGVLFWVIGAYLMAGVVLFPVTILNVATIATFGPVMGNAYAFAGWLCSAALGYIVGRVMGRELVRKMARSGMDHFIHRAEQHGFLTVLSARIVPVAPFTVVNLLVGASGIRFKDFFLATIVGRIPGLVTLTLLGVQLETFLRRPAVETSILLAVTLLVIPLVTAWLCKRLTSYDRGRKYPANADR
jgi:phospholipase D1/2